MEYIYLLQRESDENYDSFKIGMTTDINHRLRASDYRRATIYLVRAVPKSTARGVEQSILSSFKLRFTQTKNQFKGFGKEDFIFENDDLFKAIDLINNICNEILKSNNEYQIRQKLNSLEFSSRNNEKDEEETKISDKKIKILDEDEEDDIFDITNLQPKIIYHDKKETNISDEEEEDNIFDITNLQPKTINHDITLNPISFTKSKQNENENKHISKIKIEIDDFRKIFDTVGMLYIVKDIVLFKTYFDGIINLNDTLKYRIDYINKFVDIKFDRLYLKRSPRLSTQPMIKSPYLTQIVKIDNILLVGINQSDIYNPLTIRFYIPNNAFEKEIQNWELLGVLENPILLKCFKSHGFNCYAIN